MNGNRKYHACAVTKSGYLYCIGCTFPYPGEEGIAGDSAEKIDIGAGMISGDKVFLNSRSVTACSRFMFPTCVE